jgi:C4-type Zn-finger protein
MNQCPYCENLKTFITIENDTIYYVNNIIKVLVPVHHCKSCKLMWTDYVAEEIHDTATKPFRKIKRSKLNG